MPEEEARLTGAGAVETVVAAAAAAGRRGGRVILAGAERDAAFARDAEEGMSKATRSVAGKMVFFDGRRGIVDKVSEVDIVAVEPSGLEPAAGQ